MTDRLQDAETVELIVTDEQKEQIEIGEVEDFSIGFDRGDSDVEPTAMVAGQTEYEFSVMFEASPLFVLWWYGVLKQRE